MEDQMVTCPCDLEKTLPGFGTGSQGVEENGHEPGWADQDDGRRINTLVEACHRLQEDLRWRTAERDALLQSLEYHLGGLLLNRLHLRAPLHVAWWLWAALGSHLVCTRLAVERFFMGRPKNCRVMTTICTDFPIYSQTFVHQELTQLIQRGFDIRVVYSKLRARHDLHTPFARLWKAKRRLFLHRKVHATDFNYYQTRMPEKVEALIDKLGHASGLTRQALRSHDNFLQAFSFTRMVEAYRPHYLHSYFFYDRSLMALIASYLLGIPRGISCYADHLLEDYELKVVRLHLELCDVVIATSERIKGELLEIAPETNPARILVKPNAIDTACFTPHRRREPATHEVFRLVCVNRIEPKKGLLYLVEAIALLCQRGLRAELHVVGDMDEWSPASRDYKRRLDQRISELNLWGIVHLEGQHNAEGVQQYLNRAHLFLAPFVEMPSGDKDGIPTALLEGMATGLPIVATDAGSITEVIKHRREGLLVPQRDPAALADAIQELLCDPGQRLKMGLEAVNTVQRHFDVRVCEQRFHKRIRNILEARFEPKLSDAEQAR